MVENKTYLYSNEELASHFIVCAEAQHKLNVQSQRGVQQFRSDRFSKIQGIAKCIENYRFVISHYFFFGGRLSKLEGIFGVSNTQSPTHCVLKSLLLYGHEETLKKYTPVISSGSSSPRIVPRDGKVGTSPVQR